MKPIVSIIIPVYNREHLIAESLNSLLAQEYKNWECIIVDDGSQDQTRTVIEEYCFRDARFKFYQRPGNSKKGASACRNYGLEKARGELIQFLDSDDILASDKLTTQIKIYDPKNLYLLTGSWGGFTDSKDLSSRFKYKYHSYRSFQKGINLLNTFGLFNEFFPLHVYLTPVKLIEKAGFWNDELTNNDDAEFFTRVILNADGIKFVPEAVAYYRYHSPDNLSEINTSEKITSLLNSLELIDCEIKKRFGNSNKYYVRRAKSNLYKILKKNDQIFLDNMHSLKKEGRSYDSFLYNIRKKIIQYLSRF